MVREPQAEGKSGECLRDGALDAGTSYARLRSSWPSEKNNRSILATACGCTQLGPGAGALGLRTGARTRQRRRVSTGVRALGSRESGCVRINLRTSALACQKRGISFLCGVSRRDREAGRIGVGRPCGVGGGSPLRGGRVSGIGRPGRRDREAASAGRGVAPAGSGPSCRGRRGSGVLRTDELWGRARVRREGRVGRGCVPRGCFRLFESEPWVTCDDSVSGHPGTVAHPNRVAILELF